MAIGNTRLSLLLPRLLILAALLALCVGFALPARSVFAAPFSAGNVVVYRVGDGSEPLANSGNPIFLDEFTPSGVLVQSIALRTTPVGPQRAIFSSGTASSEGLLSRSADGRYILLTGYSARIGTSLSRTSAAVVPRVVARVDINGNVDTSTALADFSDLNNPRSATSDDGTRIWVTGGAGGIRTTTLGATTSTQIADSPPSARQLAIFNGQLFATSNSGPTGHRAVSAVGSGLPTTSGQTVTPLPGLTQLVTPSPFSFFFADLSDFVEGDDTLYVADDETGALTKFALVNGVWVRRGTIGVAADTYRGLSGIVEGTTATLFATRKGGTLAGGGGELVRITDAGGYEGALAGTPTVIATAAPNTAFRGVALAPTPPSPIPNTAITERPSAVTMDTIATFGFTGSDDATPAGALTFECSVDDALFTACTSPVSYTDLAPGSHVFRVRAIDGDNNTDPTPAQVRWVVATESYYLPIMQR